MGDAVSSGARPSSMRAWSGRPRPVAMRSKTASSSIGPAVPRMILLTRDWPIPVAVPMRTWLAPAYLTARPKSPPMSRFLRISRLSSRSQTDAGISIGSKPLCRIADLRLTVPRVCTLL